jgi:hypothetical protein
VDVSAIASAYKPTLSAWEWGYFFWAILFYLIFAIAVALPATIAAGFPVNDAHRRAAAAIAAVTAAAIGGLHLGERATAHEHAYICLEMGMNALSAGAYRTVEEFKQDADRCAAYINYEYVDKLPR